MLMKLDKKTVQHIASVARLKLTDKEIETFLPQLKEILDNFSELDKVDTKGVEAKFQPVALKNVMREDKVGHCVDREDALSLTEHKKDGYFKGPRAV